MMGFEQSLGHASGMGIYEPDGYKKNDARFGRCGRGGGAARADCRTARNLLFAFMGWGVLERS